MTNETTLQNNKDLFKEHLNISRDVIINHIRKIHPNCDIKVMTNKSDILNRAKHFGAHICVDSSHYYYITFSRKDEYCEHYFSLNANLLELLKHCNEDWHLLLICYGKVHTFDAKAIVDNAKLFNETTYKVPLSVESSKVNADFRYAYNKETECVIDFTFLGNVRYSKKFDMHKTKCCLIYDHSARVTDNGRETKAIHLHRVFSTVKDLYDFLNKCKVFSKPMSMRAFYKYLKRGFIETNINSVKEKIYIATEKAACQPQFFDCYPEAVAHCALSLLVDSKSTTNRDSAQQAVHQDKDNNVKMAADKQPNISRTVTKEKLAKIDKSFDTLAQKLADKEEHISEQDIKKAVLSFGSNRNMLEAYIDTLKEKHLDKEAVYAASLFDVLNNVKL